MKLYTEEQVREAINKSLEFRNDDAEFYSDDEVIDLLTPIEIPSDDIIKEAANGNIDGYYGAMWLKYNYIIKKKS